MTAAEEEAVAVTVTVVIDARVVAAVEAVEEVEADRDVAAGGELTEDARTVFVTVATREELTGDST